MVQNAGWRTVLWAGIVLSSLPLHAGDDLWTQWRGPHRNGQIQAEPWPDSLQGDRLKQQWRVKLGPGYSGPLVTQDRVFVTETRGAKTEVVQALQRETGALIWKSEWAGALSVPFFAKANGDWIRSTPAFDGQSLFAGGMRDVLVSLKGDGGQEAWRVDFVERDRAPLPAFGLVCSPLVTDDAVYLQAGAAFCKLDKATGKTIWRTMKDSGGMEGSAFSSPIQASIHGREQLIVQSRKSLAGVDPITGEILWSQEVPAFRGMNILTPTVIGNTVVTSTYGGKTTCYQIVSQGGRLMVKPAWEINLQGYMSSPVVVGDFIYLHLKNQRFTCLNAQTGKEQWRTEPFGRYWSLVANGSRILALDERGELLLIAANPERFELLDRRVLSDQESWAHLAVAGPNLYVRELGAITAYTWTRD